MENMLWFSTVMIMDDKVRGKYDGNALAGN